MDRRYLTVVIEHYDGGPVGVEALAAALAEPRDTLEDVVEPFLIQQGYIGRTRAVASPTERPTRRSVRSRPHRGLRRESGPEPRSAIVFD